MPVKEDSKNTVSSKSRRLAASRKKQLVSQLQREQALENDSFDEPIKQKYSGNNKIFLEQQQEQKLEQVSKKPQKSAVYEREKKYVSSQVSKRKEKALQVKQNFEERMNAFRDNSELSARENFDMPEKPQKMSLKDAVKRQAKEYGKKQIGKGVDYAKQRIQTNPTLKSAANKISEARERAEAIQRRTEAIQKQAKLVADRKNLIKKMANEKAKQLAKKAAIEVAKKAELAAQVARAALQFAIRILVAVIAALGDVIVIVIVVIALIAIVVVVVDYACSGNFITEAFCGASGIDTGAL